MSPGAATPPWKWLKPRLLLLTGLFYAFHFLHLRADFPSGTDWVDWSRYTDEGWYSDAAARHFLFGHWYLPGDFNPAVALPVWPLLESGVFSIAGVSLVAARALAVAVFGVTLLAVYRVIGRGEALTRSGYRSSAAATLAVLFLSLSPFVFAFERMAILEPLLGALTLLALLCALHLPLRHGQALPGPGGHTHLRQRRASNWASVALGVLLPAMVLTKPTATALLPAVLCAVWARAGYRLRLALRLALVPVSLGVVLWMGYYLLLIRPHFPGDYRYLFEANNYTGFQTDPLADVFFRTVADGMWMGTVLYPLFFALLASLLVLRPHFFRNPLVFPLLLWIAGYFVFLGYHNNLQSRYYLLLALPVTMLAAMALESFRQPRGTAATSPSSLRSGAVALAGLAIAVPDAGQQVRFLLHPAYTFDDAAAAVARRVRAEPAHSPLLLSVSGSDLTLMTGLPSINTEFGTLDLDQRVRQYRPGWYVAWNQVNDEDMKDIAPFYGPVLVASYPAMDDPDRNVLLLYRLDPLHAPIPPAAGASRRKEGRFGVPQVGILPGTGHHGRGAKILSP